MGLQNHEIIPPKLLFRHTPPESKQEKAEELTWLFQQNQSKATSTRDALCSFLLRKARRFLAKENETRLII